MKSAELSRLMCSPSASVETKKWNRNHWQPSNASCNEIHWTCSPQTKHDCFFSNFKHILILIIRRDKARSVEQSDYLQLDAAFLCRKLHRCISAADENAGIYIYFENIYVHDTLYNVCACEKKEQMQDNSKMIRLVKLLKDWYKKTCIIHLKFLLPQ